MPDESDIQARLQALRTAYAEQLPDKLAEVARQWAGMQAQPWSPEQAAVLHRQLHTLAGSAPTFGFADIGRRARQAERLLKAWSNALHGPGEGEAAELNGHIQALCTGHGDLRA
ncbi:MAG TPA: hypothetical protein ENJ17_00205 [Gammaproteobacteria bacterium]|nr:hypothetical protein [Gammaproteobacteria bacterium]